MFVFYSEFYNSSYSVEQKILAIAHARYGVIFINILELVFFWCRVKGTILVYFNTETTAQYSV